jgi:hypothetical protein
VAQYLEELTDLVMYLCRVPQRLRRIDPVVVAPALADDLEVAGRLEFGDDALDRSFGDADALGNVPYAEVWLGGDREQDMSVVGEEGPRTL